MANQEIRRAVIVGGNRIPFARSNKEYSNESNQDMLTAAIEGLVARFGLAGEEIGEVSAGAVLKHSRDFNLVREVVLSTSLAPTTPAYDVQQACATGMETMGSIANKIKLGQIDSGISGGVDTTSDAPIAISDGARKALLEANRQKTPLDQVKALTKIRPSDLAPATPSTGEPRTGLSMGEHQAITTAKWGVTRAEQDELAAASHQNLARAYDEGFFTDLVTPYRGVNKDTNLRADTTVEKLAKLKPAFGRGLETEPTMTAGNSTTLTDGASSVLISSVEWAEERGLPILADVIDTEAAAVDFVYGDEGLLMAPVYATPRILARNGFTFDDFDFFEIHEAFAGTVLATMKAWEDEEFCKEKLGLDSALGSIPREKLNVNGSSLATGHPFAATGGRIGASLAKMLRQKTNETGEVSRGFVSVCAAGGQGVVAILEARP